MKKPHNLMPVKSRAFTLIELLTVIAIIGILASIIIPTVGKVRQTARHSQNVSNIRQLTVGNLTYHADNRKFPSGNDWEGDVRSWPQRIAKYCGTSLESFVNGQVPPGIFAFPDASALNAYGQQQIINTGDSGTFSFYSRNGTIYVNDAEVANGRSVRSMSQIRNPSRLYLISDFGHWDTWGVNNTANFPGYFGDKYTFGFADGHVKSFRAGTVPAARPGDAAYDEQFWIAKAQ